MLSKICQYPHKHKELKKTIFEYKKQGFKTSDIFEQKGQFNVQIVLLNLLCGFDFLFNLTCLEE